MKDCRHKILNVYYFVGKRNCPDSNLFIY